MTLRVDTVPQTSANRRTFRTVARHSTGDTFEPGQSEVIFFGFIGHDTVAVSCYEPADPLLVDPTPSTNITTAYAHCVSYIFVKPGFQSHGFGSKLMDAMECNMEKRLPGRPYRLHASRKAVSFFEKLGYVQCGSAFRPVCPGSPLFNMLIPMEKLRSQK